jgi:16S rRNA (adenine1518-N6/adenine1519-N6)-dimethyltransferase
MMRRGQCADARQNRTGAVTMRGRQPPVRSSKRPKLGQHFLQDPHYRKRILDELRLRADDVVIEIGPGRGAMTGLLVECVRKVVAIEIDSALAQRLQEEFTGESRVAVLHTDVLGVDFAELCRQQGVSQCFVFGNLPYYITSPILHHLFTYGDCIRAMGLLVQREVAERLAAAPGTRDYGYLTVSTQLYFQPRIVLTVPPGAFSPPPKVHSALVALQRSPRFSHWRREEAEEFLEFAKRCFAQKRKTLLNNLAGSFSRDHVARVLAEAGKPTNIRAEQLSVEELAAVFEHLTLKKL